jgi:hypothetical protein
MSILAATEEFLLPASVASGFSAPPENLGIDADDRPLSL